MQKTHKETVGAISPTEVMKIQEALRRASGGMVVVPVRDGRRLAPHLVPVKPNGELNRKCLESLTMRLKSMGCQSATGITTRGSAIELLSETESV